MRGCLKFCGNLFEQRVVRAMDHVDRFHDSYGNRVDLSCGAITLCVHCDFQFMVWIALRIVRVR